MLTMYKFGKRLYKDIRNNRIIAAKSKILAFNEFYDYYKSKGEGPPTMKEIEEVE